MYELIKTIGNTYYFDCPSKVGVYVDGGKDVWLIDGGSDKDAGRKILRAVNECGWKVKAIINTHAHADHFGGDRFIADRTGCAVYASSFESVIENYPIFEPISLYGGYPPKELRNKFLMGQAVAAEDIALAKLPVGMETVDLGGHALGMIGVRTPDNVWFIADTLSSPETIEKYHVSFTCDVGAYLASLDTVAGLEGAYFVPAHAEPGEKMDELIRLNREKCLEVMALIKEICAEGSDGDTVIKKVFDRYGLAMTFQQYALIGSTVRSYLSYLLDSGEMEIVIEDNMILWRSIERGRQ